MIELFTAATPNGWKVSIALEELGLPYTVRSLNLSKLEQKEIWYRQINPNGRIPAIIDHDNGDFAVFESGAILLYLCERHGAGKASPLLPTEPKARSRVMQWLMFQESGVGPMMNQANVFYRYAPEKIPYAIERYQREVRRLFEVMERQLAEHEYIAGAQYTIADIALWPWVGGHAWSGVTQDGLPHVQRWMELIATRPAARRGREIPQPRDQGDVHQARVDSARRMRP